jgi:hypothetical protein
MKARAVLLVLASIAAVPATAQVTSLVTDHPAPKGSDPHKIVCEREDVIGTRLAGKKVCKTVAEWQEERFAQRRTVEDVQRQATSTGCPEGANGSAC